MDVLDVKEITKSFKSGMLFSVREILHGVSFYAREGEILGFLGPNGAGKTTTIKIILGLIQPDSGIVTIFGKPAGDRHVLARLGYLPENPYFYPHLTLIEFLRFCGSMSGIPGDKLRDRCDEVISVVGLESHEKQRMKSYSKGMLQRAGLAQAVLHDPDLLILDEPFSGLDPIGRKTVRDILLDLKKKGKTIFFSSHILPDMEALCDRACIIRGGIITKSMNLDDIFRIGENRIEITARGCDSGMLDMVEDYLESSNITGEETFLVVKKQEYLRTVVQHLYNSGAEILRIVNEHSSLEDIFMDEISCDPVERRELIAEKDTEKNEKKEKVL